MHTPPGDLVLARTGPLPFRVVGSGRGFLWRFLCIVPRGAHFVRGLVVESAVRPVVVVVDVGGDHLPRLVERLELVAPDAALLQVAKPALDEGLRLGVAVAAAAVGDTERANRQSRRACGEGGAVVPRSPLPR